MTHPAPGVTLDRLGAWLLAAPRGEAMVLTGATADIARAALAEAELPADRRIGVVFPLDPTTPPERVADRAAAALASTALAAFPFWYQGDDLVGLGAGNLTTALLDARLRRAELVAPAAETSPDPVAPDAPWAGPIEGRPHWASAAEQCLARALAADAGLAPLFAFNQTVPTARGGRPRVDLLWRAGRLVVEIDGYADHATREAFRRDRHRDYELAISGYLVLRLTAEEVVADPVLSLDKLRDAVNFRRGDEPATPA
jgi:very-short-patch-repair endonuclease